MRALDLRKIANQRVTEHRRATISRHAHWIEQQERRIEEETRERAEEGLYRHTVEYGIMQFPNGVTEDEREFLLGELEKRFVNKGFEVQRLSIMSISGVKSIKLDWSARGSFRQY